LLLPGFAFPDTPPSSPLLNARGNAFAQWSPSSHPSSPTLSQYQWSHLGTDTESEAGLQSDLEDDTESAEGVRKPKGHPLGAWGTKKSKGLGLGLGLGRFGFSNQNQEILSSSDEMFEKKAERRRESIHVSFLATHFFLSSTRSTC